MENIIARLVTSYENGALSRRQLVASLAKLMAAGAAGASAVSAFQTPAQEPAMMAGTLDHVSLQVKNLERSVEFYKSVFGLPFLNEDKATKTVRLKVGPSRLVLRNFEPTGVVDHIGLGIVHLDKAAVKAKLKERGIPALETGEPLQFHVVDPDGYPIQMISLDNR